MSYPSSFSTVTSTLTYVHTSYLGTPVLETDSKGDIVYIALTDINGNAILRDERNDSSLQNKLYTGHKYDNVTGLTYAHARYLDTRTHTFTSVDPLYYQLSSAQLYNPQLMNAYSYANNNPVVNTDPTGLFSISSAWNSVKSAVSSAVSSVKSAVSSVVSSIKSAGASASSLVSSAASYVSSNVNIKSAASSIYAVGAGIVASGVNLAIGISNIASIANSFSIVGAANNYLRTGSVAPTLIQPTDASTYGVTGTTQITQFNSAKIGGDIAQVVTPAAVEFGLSRATTIVGRWMSSAEYTAMKETGKIQIGSGGVTYVNTGGIENSWKGAPLSSVYAEFSVRSRNLVAGGNSNWFKLVSEEANNSTKNSLIKQSGDFLENIIVNNLSGIIGTK